MKKKILASLLAAMFLGVSMGTVQVNAAQLPLATTIVIDGSDGGTSNGAVNPPVVVNKPTEGTVPGTVVPPANDKGPKPSKAHKPHKAHKNNKVNKPHKTRPVFPGILKPNNPRPQQPPISRPNNPPRPNGTYRPTNPKPANPKPAAPKTSGSKTYVHGAHWCYGACSLHDAGQHNAPRTEKHWCDGYRRN